MMMMMMMNCFCVIIDLQAAGSCISRKDHQFYHRDFPTRSGRNRSQIAETAIRSATTLPQRQKYLSGWCSYAAAASVCSMLMLIVWPTFDE